jgi:uncharacterized Zn-binding protein involved in type VI secretion
MGKPIAKEDDRIVGVDIHIVLVPSGSGTTPTPTPMPFSGKISQQLSPTIFVDNKAAAVKGSVAENQPAHVPTGGSFQKPPSNRGTIDSGSGTVFMDNQEVARAGDTAKTCNDPADAPKGLVVAQGTVFAG